MVLRLNANEDGENILGYDLYSSALADILTEPALTMPITVGLYAKWGSGKSFLLGKLKDEMLSFTREWIVEPVSLFSTSAAYICMYVVASLSKLVRH
jgi:ankyrin repeat-rich membrane spanning protein